MPTEDASPRLRDAASAAGPGEADDRGGFPVERIRRDFPALAQQVNGRPLIYLDSASTAQKPRAVIEALLGYYQRDCANIHRGVHTLSQRATAAYEAVREKVAAFLGAGSPQEIVFTRGTTEALNLLAHGLGRLGLGEGDEVLVSGLEHHSNIVPWQLVCKERGARLRVIPLDADGRPRLAALTDGLLGPRTRIVSLSHAGNALGTIVPIAELAARAKAVGALVIVDGAQAAPHLPVDVAELGCDFYCFSGHKLYGPTGVGALWGRAELLAKLPPWQGGGDMILSVAFSHSEYQEPPQRFEAGTPPIAEVIGLGAAIDYLEALGRPAIARYEAGLYAHGRAALSRVPGVRIYGGETTSGEQVPVLSFSVAAIHPHDVGSVLDQQGIAVRTGHHCAEPLMRHLGVPGTVRASLAFYNTTDELDALAAGLGEVVRLFGGG